MEGLPESTLVDIFKYFNNEDLKLLAEVCQRWSQIIRSSNFLSRRSAVTIETKKHTQTFIKLSIFDNIFNLNIFGLPDEVVLQDFVSKYENTIEHATIENIKGIEEFELIKRFQILESIESLALSNCKLACEDAIESREMEWRNLKYLKVREFNGCVENYFRNAKLKKLKLVAMKTPQLGPNQDFWLNLSQHLEELRILRAAVSFDSVLTVLNAKHLRKLQLNLKFIKDNLAELLEATRKLNFVKITFKGVSRNSPSIQSVISNDSSVRRLKFINTAFDDRDEVIAFISRSLARLTYLRLPLNYGIMPSESRILFENLETVEFEAIKYPVHVNRMLYVIHKSPNVRRVKIHWISNHAVGGDLFERLGKIAARVEHLHVGSKFDTFELSAEAVVDLAKNGGDCLRTFSTFTKNVEVMRRRLSALSKKGVRCVALDKNHRDCTATAEGGDEDDRFGGLLMRDENKFGTKLIATCTWSR